MAFSGYGPTHSLLLLHEAIDLNPKLIIDAFYAGNDLYDSYSHVYERMQLPDLKTSDPGVIRAISAAENLDPLAQKISRLFWLNCGEGQYHPPTSGAFREFFSMHSRLYGLARAAKATYQQNRSDFSMPVQVNSEIMGKASLTDKGYSFLFDDAN
jgi:hypothetical protein